MDNLVKTDVVFGKRVNIVGNISADLVLESLGKIYIKSRNKSLTLEEIITSLTTQDPNISTSRTKVVEGIEGLDTTDFKEGTFVFDKLSNILYLFIDDELLELINIAPEGTGYVKRSGDTMTGRLAIYVKNGPPLYVNSADLVLNLNAQYLNGETAENFTRRNKDEKIDGKWTFRRPTTFDSNTLFYKDIVANGSIGTPNFSSGFGGYGWRMDADTNTLTVDNLVVRKLMQVYELVVNKISATNGSLWVTNAGKVTAVLKLSIKESGFFLIGDSDYTKFSTGLKLGDAFIKLGTKEVRLFEDPNEIFMNASGQNILVKNNCLTVLSLLEAKLIIINNNGCDFSNLDFSSEENYKAFPLFDPNFKFDCTFPIVARNGYQEYKRYREIIVNALNELDRLNLYNGTQSAKDALIQIINYNLTNANPYTYIKYSLPYYKYFANGDYYLVSFDSDELPVFKPGDLLRCQKWTYNGVKYYDALVCSQINNNYVILLADSILDKKTTITYDSSLLPTVIELKDELNTTLYNSSSRNPNGNQLGIVEEKDGLVQIGHLWDPQRQNAVYITSTDNGAPFIDVMSGINRPDFSVIYYTPIFKTVKIYARAKGSRRFNNNLLAVDIPATINYYILDKNLHDCDYTYVKVVGEGTTEYYMIEGYADSVTSLDIGYTCTILNYLNLYPNKNTLLINDSEQYFILLEDGSHIIVDRYEEDGTIYTDGGFLLQETRSDKLLIASTKTTKARFGNLDGIQDELFPVDRLPYGYGLYGLNVFLTGEFYLSNGQAVADISKEAITFAIAGLNALNDSIELLRNDTNAAYNLLKNNVYSKGLLKTAGMTIRDNGIVMWADKLIIATTENELYGIDQPTALFSNGKIKAKFLEVHDAASDVKYIYPAISSTYAKSKDYNSGYWTQIQYSATGGSYIDNPNATGGVKLYTYEDNGYTRTKYIRKFHIDYYQDHINDTTMINESASGGNSNYDAWIEVELDGDIPDISDIHYVTFNIDGHLYSGTSLENNSIFDLQDSVVNKVLSDITLWSLRSDGTGNLGGKAIYWDEDGDLKVNSKLTSLRGSIGGLLYSKGDLYFDMLESNNYYIESKYPKLLLHDDKLKSAILLVGYEEKSYINRLNSVVLSGCAVLDTDHLYLRKGYQDSCVDLSHQEGLIYEELSDGAMATMGVSYPLVNLAIIPYKDTNDNFCFYVSCNYVPLISGINVYYKNYGLYYFVLDCSNGFANLIRNGFEQGKISVLATGVNYIYGNGQYFGSHADLGGDQSLRTVANLAGMNFSGLYIGTSSNRALLGGTSAWWQLSLTKTTSDASTSSTEGVNNGYNRVKAKNMNNLQKSLAKTEVAFKVEVLNEDGYTEGGTILHLNYNTFANSVIPELALINSDNYDVENLIDWIKLPYTTSYSSFTTRYNILLGTENSGTEGYAQDGLGFYLYWINRCIDDGGASHRNILISSNVLLYASLAHVYIPTKNSLLNIISTVVTGINDSIVRDYTLANSYFLNLNDSMTTSNINNSTSFTFSAYAKYIINSIYNILENENGLVNSTDYKPLITLQGLSEIASITPSKPIIYNSDSKLEIAQKLRDFVLRECDYMNTFLTFLERLYSNITGSSYTEGLEEPVEQQGLGTFLYSVGLISDLHINTDESDASSDAGDEADLAQALTVFKNQGVQFVAAAGDVLETWNPWEVVSSNSRTYADAERFYNTYTSLNPGFNFYSPLGNHDYFGLHERRSASEINNVYDSGERIRNIWTLWVLHPNVMGSREFTYLSDSNNLTYYFTYNNDIYVMLSIDYGGDNSGIMVEGYEGDYTFTGSNYRDTIMAKKIIDSNSNDLDTIDMFSYVSDTGYNASLDGPFNYLFYTPKALMWLYNLIEANKTKKIFVFTHHFLTHKTGDSMGVPSVNNYAYGEISHKNSHTTSTGVPRIRRGASTLCGVLFWFINKLNNTYKNVYWFSGHSHLSWNHNSGNELVCAHIDNHDYTIISPGNNDYNSSTNTDLTKKTIYTKSSMTPKTGTSGWWIALPSLSKPRTTSGTLYKEAEISIMDVYTNGIKIKGYKLGRNNGNNGTIYNLEKLVEKDLVMNATDSGSSSGGSGSEGTSGDGITLNLINNTGVEVRYNGKIVLNVWSNPNDWNNNLLLDANYHTPLGYNDIIILPNLSRSLNIPSSNISYSIHTLNGVDYKDDSLYGNTNFLDGTWYIKATVSPTNQYMYPVFLYSYYCYGDKPSDTAAHSSLNMYIPSPPDTTLLLNGKTFNITINSVNSQATLLPDLTGHYVILSANSTGL